MKDDLWQITAPYFVVGLVFNDGYCTEAAPIIKYMIGWSKLRIADYTKGKSWQLNAVYEDSP
jgi:hypothetical protein